MLQDCVVSPSFTDVLLDKMRGEHLDAGLGPQSDLVGTKSTSRCIARQAVSSLLSTEESRVWLDLSKFEERLNYCHMGSRPECRRAPHQKWYTYPPHYLFMVIHKSHWTITVFCVELLRDIL